MKAPHLDIALPEFHSERVALPWLEMFKKHPYGDYYRLSTLNPLVLQTALWAARRRATGDCSPPPVDLGTAALCQLGDKDDDPIQLFERFYKSLENDKHNNIKPLEGLRVIDLGCGTGYLGPLLTSLGASYRGVDLEAKFIKHAQGRCGRCRFDRADIDGPALSQGSYNLRDADLALSIMVLEHLHDPGVLLRQLRQTVPAGALPPIVLLATENPRYYGTALPVGAMQDKYLQQSDRVPIVCLEGLEVAVNRRDEQHLATLLRDAGYTILEGGAHRLPGRWDSFVRKRYLCGHRVDINWGLPPFISMTAVPWPVGNRKGNIDFDSLVRSTALARLRGTRHEHLLKDIAKNSSFIQLKSGQQLLSRHDLGGCLFFVTGGTLTSDDPETIFHRFDCFGELEANRGDTTSPAFGYFVHDVRAGNDGAEVFVVPERVASTLLERGGNLVSELFAGLRRKVLLRNDRLTLRAFSDRSFKKGHFEYISSDLRRVRTPVVVPGKGALIPGLDLKPARIPFSKIQKYDLGRFAGALLNLSEIEYQAQRTSARAVFCDLMELQRIADIRDRTGNTGARFSRLLTALGVMDGFPPRMLDQFTVEDNLALDKRVSNDLLEFVMLEARSAISAATASLTNAGLVRSHYDEALRQLSTVSLKKECFRNIEGKTASRTTQHFKELRSTFEQLLHQATKIESPARDSIIRSLTDAGRRLLQLNLLFKEGRPRFFVIHDIGFLRLLAYASDVEVDRCLVVRALAQTKRDRLIYDTFSDVVRALAESDDAFGRVRYYAAAFVEFIQNVWRQGGQLVYSSGGNSRLILPEEFPG